MIVWRGCGSLVKQSYELAGKPQQSIVFDWNRNLSKARWDTHKAVGLYHKHDAALVKVTKIQGDNFTENNVSECSVFLCLLFLNLSLLSSLSLTTHFTFVTASVDYVHYKFESIENIRDLKTERHLNAASEHLTTVEDLLQFGSWWWLEQLTDTHLFINMPIIHFNTQAVSSECKSRKAHTHAALTGYEMSA